MPDIRDISNETLENIFLNLDAADLARAELVCKKWCATAAAAFFIINVRGSHICSHVQLCIFCYFVLHTGRLLTIRGRRLWAAHVQSVPEVSTEMRQAALDGPACSLKGQYLDLIWFYKFKGFGRYEVNSHHIFEDVTESATAFDRCGCLLAIGSDFRRTILWDYTVGIQKASFLHKDAVVGAHFHSPEIIIVVTTRSIEWWAHKLPKCTRTIELPNRSLGGTATCSGIVNMHVIVGLSNGCVGFFDLYAGHMTRLLRLHSDKVTNVLEVRHDSITLIATVSAGYGDNLVFVDECSGKTVAIGNLPSNLRLKRFRHLEYRASRVVALLEGGTLIEWDMTHLIKLLSNDNSILYCSKDKTVLPWTGRLMCSAEAFTVPRYGKQMALVLLNNNRLMARLLPVRFFRIINNLRRRVVMLTIFVFPISLTCHPGSEDKQQP